MIDINIRLETPADYFAVEELTREAFWSFWEPGRVICDEHLLTHLLRSAPSFVPELDFVAELDGSTRGRFSCAEKSEGNASKTTAQENRPLVLPGGKIVGHIIYTKSKIVDDAGQEFETLTFGPLSVLPEFQSMGIGKALMMHSFAEAKRLGYRAVLIFGHPDYYPRVGFRRAAEFGIIPTVGDIRDPFMAYPLYDGALDGVSGRYYIDPVYAQLTEEGALEFDKQFKPKAPFFPTPISVLLDQLAPEPRSAMEGTGCVSLEMMTSISEREVSSLPGMDAKSVEIIRAALHHHGMRWGK
ncbi:MAG: GNAT family N-acetyltransferase [Oscillospiraceae bacterium]|nr:GNAT family N-acetyltransferase [Oscillospiraceae bacterium]